MKTLAEKFSRLTGLKTYRARRGVGSMRDYFETVVKFDGTQNELRIFLAQQLGFQPFFVQSWHIENKFDVNVEISKLEAA